MAVDRDRIYLSPPHLGELEETYLREALESNWIAPYGPQLEAFESEMAQYIGVRHAVALTSGTAALHLALIVAGVGPGDRVICPTLTFVASANVIRYVGAEPVFIDSDRASWTLDADLLRHELERRAGSRNLPAAAIVVDIFGQPADYERILRLCAEHRVPVIEDAAEALGSTYRDSKAGSFGLGSVVSFNGNKIITTSGGGMFLTNDPTLAERVRALSTQARDPAPHYEHSELGYNYRMSNLLAALGRGQLRVLDSHVAARRRVFDRYQDLLRGVPGIEFMPEPGYGESNRWLSCITVDPAEFGATREDIRLSLEAVNVESRPLWKPMHLQPLYSGARVVGGAVSEQLFEDGLALPSGSALSAEDQERITKRITETARM